MQPATPNSTPTSNDNAARFLDTAEAVHRENKSWGLTYLLPFAQAVRRLDPAQHGIGPESMTRVLQAWENCEDWVWKGGFIVELADGRRAWIEAIAEGFVWDDQATVDVALKPSGFDFLSSEIPRDNAVRIYGWTDHLPELNAFLQRLNEG